MRIQDFKEFLNLLNPAEFEKGDAKDLINNLANIHSSIEDVLSEFGVHHQIRVELGEHYNGRKWLVLEDYDNGWDEKEVAGMWKASAGTC